MCVLCICDKIQSKLTEACHLTRHSAGSRAAAAYPWQEWHQKPFIVKGGRI